MKIQLFLLVLIGLAMIVAYCLNRLHKQKVNSSEQEDVTPSHEQDDVIIGQYQNMIADMMQDFTQLTDDDKKFLGELTSAIIVATEKGITDIETIAGRMQIKVATLRRRLSLSLSLTPMTYILQVRMRKAKYLLQNYRVITITKVARKCGYTQVPNFTRAFTRYYGFTPSDMRSKKE